MPRTRWTVGDVAPRLAFRLPKPRRTPSSKSVRWEESQSRSDVSYWHVGNVPHGERFTTMMFAVPRGSCGTIRCRRPSLSRQGHLIIAHRFSGGTNAHLPPSPGRGDRIPHRDTPPLFVTSSLTSSVPSGTRPLSGITLPPLKRWAIFGCPCRDKERTFGRKHRHWKLISQGTCDFRSCSQHSPRPPDGGPSVISL